jgi:3-hydroxybutyryl-CoA dehydrogenase
MGLAGNATAGALALVPRVIGVVGAGTMGAGIAQLAAQAGARTLLYDALPDALERGLAAAAAGLERLAQRGRLEPAEAERARSRLEPVAELEALGECELVIEAAPERLELKRELFASLARVVAPDCVLATNTSSLSVTEIAAAAPHPERVVGLHFFNPAPVMGLVELVAAQQSSERALGIARAAAEAMGKRVIDAVDATGFIVNRCNRPFSLEALRVLAERLASVEQIDRIARLGGGFPMGPFELQDLVGIDTNHAVAETFHRASYGEPRFQPSPLQARMVAAGRLGRKTGAGWYEYAAGVERYRPEDPEPPEAGGGEGRRVVVAGSLPVASELRAAAAAAGFDVRERAGEREPWLTLDCSGRPAGAQPRVPARLAAPAGLRAAPGPAAPQQRSGAAAELPARARLLHDCSLACAEPTAAGFHVLAPLAGASLVELTSTPATGERSLRRTEEFFACLGMGAEHVGDAPGLVLGRIVAALINEAAFLLGEGGATPADLDEGMRLGVNHPRGPLEWSRALGLEHVLALLDALHRERGEPRYRAAPLLRARAALGAELA